MLAPIESPVRCNLPLLVSISALAAVAVIASSCGHQGSRSSEPHEVWASGGSGLMMLARITDRLYLNPHTRCVSLGRGKPTEGLALPRTYRFRLHPLRLEAQDGTVVARDGDWIRGGGGGKSNHRCAIDGQIVFLGRIEFWGRTRPHGNTHAATRTGTDAAR
jgi:hypothetical protein